MKKAVIVIGLVSLSFLMLDSAQGKPSLKPKVKTQATSTPTTPAPSTSPNSNLTKFCSDKDLIYFVDNGGRSTIPGRNDLIVVISDSPYCKGPIS